MSIGERIVWAIWFFCMVVIFGSATLSILGVI
jgi:hypothetical protein